MGCKVLKIGVFFDGTGNNKTRDGKAKSNVAKLSALYLQGEHEINGKKTFCAMVYKNGVGTYDTWWEHHLNWIDRKYDKGGGGGGAVRINEAINEVKALLKAHPYGTGDDDYKSREIDVFGFSRGAAMARDFLNTFYFKEYKKFKGVKFNFIGIYDTVGSFGRPGNDIDMKPTNTQKGNESDMKLSQFLNGDWGIGEHIGGGFFEPYNFHLSSTQAKKIVHMTAHDEVRKNFPLFNAQGASSEHSFIGVHSDIGGGYPERKNEKHRMYLKTYKGSKGLGNLLHDQKAVARAYGEKELARLKSVGALSSSWYVDIETETHLGYQVDEYKVYLKTNRIVNNDLATVTLYLMHKEALKMNVPLQAITEPMPKSMQNYFSVVETNIGYANRYAKEAEGIAIKRDYVHHSAVDPANIDTRYYGDTGVIAILFNDSADGEGNDARYVDINGNVVDGRKNPNKAAKVEREIYQNDTSLAIGPGIVHNNQ